MMIPGAQVRLRMPEPRDVDALYAQKNDPDVALMLGGFCSGYSHHDIAHWIDSHSNRGDEIIWVIASADNDRCLGHAGLYHIDHRIRSAEFAIMIGDKTAWGKGMGRAVSAAVVDYGFSMLNLNRVCLYMLSSNPRAQKLYTSLGFKQEGVLREAQFKGGRYLDLIVMSRLRREAVDRAE